MTAEPAEHLRELAPRVLAAVLGRYRDFAAAEDAVQEALLAALTQWPRDGAPDNPRAWLTQVALRRMSDQWRADTARRRREEDAAREAERLAPARGGNGADDGDDSLLLLFLCCHPVLTPSSAIALTLRAVGGLTTAEIAHAFLVPEATLGQRISRAKLAIQQTGARFEPPSPEERAARLRSVMHILYLIFNEGYTSTSGAGLRRDDLAVEAIRLARLLRAQLPREPEAAGLLALMLLTDARRAARATPDGELIPLDAQDRTLWDRAAIAEGQALLSEALPQGAVGPYQLQAAIAAVHAEAPCAEDTDWPQILALYDLLLPMADNPMAALSRAVAAAMVHGPARGLALLAPLAADPRLAQHHRLAAVRAHLLEMAGDREAAIANYRAAAARATNQAEQNYLTLRAASLAI